MSVFVVAGSEREFYQWCEAYRTNPRGVRNVRSEDDLRDARADSVVILHGRFQDNPVWMSRSLLTLDRTA